MKKIFTVLFEVDVPDWIEKYEKSFPHRECLLEANKNVVICYSHNNDVVTVGAFPVIQIIEIKSKNSK